MSSERSSSPTPSLLPAIAAVQSYEQFIQSSRGDFLRSLQGDLTFSDAIRLSDDLNLRLEYYRHIHALRRDLKDSARRRPLLPGRNFDFTLSIRSGAESKEYDFVERQASELLIVLQRMKDEVE
jgi:hypothetical protein